MLGPGSYSVSLDTLVKHSFNSRAQTPTRSRPRAGDRRVTKRHGLQIRVQCMARDFMTGKPLGLLVRNGRPVYDWRKPAELDLWDLHLLTESERAAL